jgi:hypothetical protein
MERETDSPNDFPPSSLYSPPCVHSAYRDILPWHDVQECRRRAAVGSNLS